MAELAKWEAEGLVGPSVAGAIRGRYSPRSSLGERRNWGIVVSCSIGALLVGLGIIALLAANWEFLTRTMRAAIAVFPVLSCALAAYWAAARKLRSRFFWETVGTMWMMTAIAALLIVATTYQVSDDSPALVMAMCVLTLPVVLLTRAALPTIGWMALPLVWFCMKCADIQSSPWPATHDAEVVKAFVTFVALQAAGGMAVLRTVLAGEYAPLASLVHAGLSIILPTAAIASAVAFGGATAAGNFSDALIIASVVFGGVAIYHLGALVRWPGLKFVTLALFGWAFLIIPINDGQRGLWLLFLTPLDMRGIGAAIAPLAFNGAAALLLAALCGKERNWTLIALPFVFLAVGLALPPNAAAIAAYVLALAWCAWMFLRGIKYDALDRMNTGAIGLVYLIMAKFLASDATFTMKGIILIASGAAITAANVFIIRRRRKGGAK